MNERLPSRRTSRGAVWRRARFGDAFGRRYAEWAHVTPEFPDGIPDSALKTSNLAVQQEVAVFWFCANLKPYDLAGTAPYGGYTVAAGPYAPSPVRALHALEGEFKDVIPQSVILSLSSMLGNSWMWNDEGSPQPPRPENKEKFEAALLAAIEDLSVHIRALNQPHVGIGHNRPPEELPLSPSEQKNVLKIIEKAKVDIKSPTALLQVWSKLAPTIRRLGEWTGTQINKFISGIALEGGKSLGRALPNMLLVGVGIWVDHQAVVELIGGFLASQTVRHERDD